MSKSVRELVLQLHRRLLKLEESKKSSSYSMEGLGIRGGGAQHHYVSPFETVTVDERKLEELYEALEHSRWCVVNHEKCGWQLDPFDGDYRVTGKGMRDCCLYVIEIECNNSVYSVTCTEDTEDFDQEPRQLTYATTSLSEVETWLDEAFPK